MLLMCDIDFEPCIYIYTHIWLLHKHHFAIQVPKTKTAMWDYNKQLTAAQKKKNIKLNLY